jgi:hypothetical protein
LVLGARHRSALEAGASPGWGAAPTLLKRRDPA